MPFSVQSSINADKAVDFEKKLLLKKIAGMTTLPTPSAHVMKVMLLLRDEEVKMGSLIATIERDQSLVAQILKLINSGYYGLRKTVDSVERAVNLLGILNIKHLVYSAAIMDLFSNDEQAEWLHSYSASVLMGNLLKENEIPGLANTLPLSMLMHDIGKVVLRRFSPKKYSLAVSHSVNDRTPSFRAEEAILHINHAEVGGILLEKWDMDEEIIKPVLYHHMENVPKDHVLETALMQFVNWVDCNARDIICLEPTKALLDSAGIEQIDKEYWVEYQKKLIATINGTSEPGQAISHDHKHLSTARIKRSENVPGTEPLKGHIAAVKVSEAASQTAAKEKAEQIQAAAANAPQQAPTTPPPHADAAHEPDTAVIHRPSAAPRTPQAQTEPSTAVIQRPLAETSHAIPAAAASAAKPQAPPAPASNDDSDMKVIQRPKAPSVAPVQKPEEPADSGEVVSEDIESISTETSTRLIRKPKNLGMIPPEPQVPALQHSSPLPQARPKAQAPIRIETPPPAPPASSTPPVQKPPAPPMPTEVMSRSLANKNVPKVPGSDSKT
ncbi:MAG: hypothetical protein A2X49_10660 [Lentisphaerae bacterium GWF2_52_8]|nr:MAG: hypothetical protein A2X49_10660 [Lentisphaerae bacterium GWF2_52_8]